MVGGAIVLVSWVLLIVGLLTDDWQLVLLLGPVAAVGNAVGWRRLDRRVARFATAGFGITLLLLSLLLPLGTGTVLVLL